jgi:hypothetical protein
MVPEIVPRSNWANAVDAETSIETAASAPSAHLETRREVLRGMPYLLEQTVAMVEPLAKTT